VYCLSKNGKREIVEALSRWIVEWAGKAQGICRHQKNEEKIDEKRTERGIKNKMRRGRHMKKGGKRTGGL
jgi:hypothetical protein